MYQALYRKYRPRTFDDVVGQVGVTETLKAQLAAGKHSHAYLFTGTRGTGKTSCARILAKAVNCTESKDGNPCGYCDACKMIDAETCVDVQEIDAASNNGVDQIRALRDEAVYTPSQVKMRVYIVDEVHMLSMQAFNALLKLIEEPPEHLMFILATTELHKVPATILSRCQRFSFRRLQVSDISARLGYVAYEEGMDLQPDAAELLAGLADGAMRDALSLLDQCASATVGPVTTETVCSVLGLAGQQKTAQLLHAMADRDANRALTIFSELYSAGKDLSAMLGEVSTLARDLLILRTAPKSGPGMLSGISSKQDREELLKKLSPAELLRIVSRTQTTVANFAISANRRLDTELCLLELCNPAISLDLQSISARLGQVEEKIASGQLVSAPAHPSEEPLPEISAEPQAEAKPQEPVAPAKPQPVNDLPADFWPEFLSRVKSEIPPQFGSFFSVNGPIRPRLQGNTLFLETESDFVLNIIKNDTQTTQLLSRKASAMLGRPVSVQLGELGKTGLPQGDPLDDLLQLGNQHSDIFTINR